MTTEIKNKTTTTSDLKTQTSSGLSVRSLDDLPEIKVAEGAEQLAILGDTSGSMGSFYSTGKTRLQGLQDALNSLWEITDWAACSTECWMFSDYVRKIEFDSTEQPKVARADHGGTDFIFALTQALDNPKRNRIILASDGEATKPVEQISQCQSRGIPIDTIYIGTNPEDHGAILLQEIAEETGGTFCLCKNASELVQQFQQLETHNRLLLTHQAGTLPGSDDVIKL